MGLGQRRQRSAAGFVSTALGVLASVVAASAFASPAQIIPGTLQAPIPGPNIGFQVNLREQDRITGTAPVRVTGARLFVGTVETERFPINFNGTCVSVGAAPLELPGANVFLEVTVANGEGSATGRFPLSNSTAPPIQDARCSYVNTPPTNADFEYDVLQFDAEQQQARVRLMGFANDRENDELTYEWLLDERTLDGQQVTLDLPVGDTLVTLRVRDRDSDQVSESRQLITIRAAATVNIGDILRFPDADGDGEQLVTITPLITGGDPVGYEWSLGDGPVVSRERVFNQTLPVGEYSVYLNVAFSDESFDGDGATLFVEGRANRAPTVDAGDPQTVTVGQSVTLSALGSDPDGDTLTYEWRNGQELLDDEQSITRQFPEGTYTLTARVRDPAGLEATDTVRITVNPSTVTPRAPTVSAGEDVTLERDTDGAVGELISLSGTASDPDGDTLSYRWMLGDTPLGTELNIRPRLPDGVSVVTLTATDPTGLSASDTVQITVPAPSVPIVNPGISQTIDDTDVQTGEMVSLSGSATGNIARYEWFLGDTSLGVGQSIRVRLPDGVSLVTLRATNAVNLTGSASVRITVATGVRTVLANVPGLTPNEKRLAESLDAACNDILGPLTQSQAPTTPRDKPLLTKAGRPPSEAEQSDFAQKCRGLLISRNNAQLKGAMGALLGDDFAAARTQTLLFANTQYASVMDRLIALRGGAKGLSLAGLNIMVDGEMIPLAQLQGLAKELLGGGASSDADGGLWSDKWGLWARGNFSFGSKEDNSLSPSFDADQYAFLAGLDYRLSQAAVIGGALAYGNSSVDFSGNDGSLDTESWALSVYGSLYAKRNFYFDAIVNVADAGYTAERNITYVDGYGLVDTDADGDTSGFTMSGGMSAGYDFLVGGLTVSPTLGVFYIDAQIDEFTESNAGGLNLIYDEQQFKSLTGTVGMRATFAWNLPFGVLLPHFRADFVREFEDDVDVFGIRFAADPNAASAPPILIETENPDSSYWRLAAGLSAQFKHGISGYVEYQRLESFRFISFEDVSVGLRFQAAF